MYNKLTLTMLMCIGALVSCNKETDAIVESSDSASETVLSKPLCFSSEDDFVAAVEALKDGRPVTRSESEDFVSYYETVMQEDGYDERPNAILGDSFGSVLNAAGEVIYGSVLVKVGECGIFYGNVADSCAIRELASLTDISNICVREKCPYFTNEADSYKVAGYDGIYVVDTFGLVLGGSDSVENVVAEIETRNYVSGVYQEKDADALGWFGGTGNAAQWAKNFKWPGTGEQKVKFSDKTHCNDTKMFQQNYGSESEDGIKIKTMRKKLAWNKINNPMEAGIINVSVHVDADFKACKSKDICHMGFVNREYDVYVIPSRGSSDVKIYGLSNAAVKKDLSSGADFVKENNISKTPDAVMYVISDAVAIVRFPDKVRYESNNSVMKLKWMVPFGGVVGAKNSYLNKGWTTAGQYYVKKLDAYAHSIRGDEKKGSMLHYTYERKK